MPSNRTQLVMQGATTIIRKCLHLGRDDSFLLIYDETTKRFPSIFAAAASRTQVRFTKAFVSKKNQASGLAFNSSLVRAISDAHGILVATTDHADCSRFRIELTTDKRGARSTVATMPGASLWILSDAVDIDYNEVSSMCHKLTVPLIKGRKCSVLSFDRSGQQYELNFQLDGKRRPPIQSYGIIPRRAWGNIPAGETFVAPIEESAQGKYLVNGAIGSERVTGPREALLEFRDGRLIDHFYVSTGSPVEYLLQVEETAKRSNHAACWSTIAEFGIGVNRYIGRISGIQLIDEKKYGTVHIAIGHNVGYGGNNDCQSVHCDMTTQSPTVRVDGETILEKGEHCYNLESFLDNYLTFKPTHRTLWKSRFIKLNADSYELSNNEVLVKKVTPSGRLTVYPLGDFETSRLASQVVRTIEKARGINVSDLSDEVKIGSEELSALLSLLFANGIVSA